MQETIIIKSSQLGVKDYIRAKNLDKLLINKYKKGYKVLIVDNKPNTKYNIIKEVQKRKLIMIIDTNKLGWRNEVRNKNLNKYLINAYNKGY